MQVKYYMVKTVNGHIVQVTEKKATKRDRYGRFTGNAFGGYCRFRGLCPLAV